MPGRAFYYKDEDGNLQDSEVLEPVLANTDGEMFFALNVISDHVAAGHSLDEAIRLFGNEAIRKAYGSGELTVESIHHFLGKE